MTRSNRTLNRLILTLVGAAFLAGAALAAWPAASRWLNAIPDPPRPQLGPIALWSVAVAAVVILALALGWILSRGRGGTRTTLTVGEVAVATTAAEHTLRDELRPVPSVLAVHASAHRLRGRTALAVTVSTRRRADLPAVLDRVRSAVLTLDATLGVEVPVVIRITTGWRSGLAHEQRAE